MTALAEFWVAVALVVFLGVLVYYRVPALLAKALDARADNIRRELDEARRLREEAQKLLTDYQQKHRDAHREAESIIEAARREAEAFAATTRNNLKDLLQRRGKAAEEKIQRAEAQAVEEVRARAVEVAVAAAEKILAARAAGAGGAALIEQGIRDLKGRLH